MNIDTNKLRSTYVKGKKAYFVSDIVGQFGERPVSRLNKNKAIFKARIKDKNNSQNRRLVLHKDLQNMAMEIAEKRFEKAKEYQKKNKEKFSMFKRIKRYYQQTKETAKKAGAPQTPVMVEISLEKIRKTSISLEKERINMMKDRIKKLCMDEGKRSVAAKRKAGLPIDTDTRIDYREPYLIMYSSFDRYMRIELNKLNTTLEDIGLGRARNAANKPYIDRIAEAGQLNNLLVVAETLFQPKTNN